MNKNCVFSELRKEGKRYCNFKQKNSSWRTCFMCVASSSEYDKLEIKDHFILANTNKNFKLQFIISIVAIFLSIIITIDKIYLTKNISERLDNQVKKMKEIESYNNYLIVRDILKENNFK